MGETAEILMNVSVIAPGIRTEFSQDASLERHRCVVLLNDVCGVFARQ
jgi:hypothetical protein